ncbi:MAG: hypothetical protein IJV08_11670 [Bacteroidaceae bacterium]|nr:hypothetical protein [Bacteroidaceae bacterium]
MKAKKLLLVIAGLTTGFAHTPLCKAQTNVTTKYIDNPNFEARFAGWVNENMSYNTSKNFAGQNGMVFMEKWVSAGGKLGSTGSIYQRLEELPVGTYTLTANAHNIQQGKDATQTGAFLYGGDEETEVSAYGEYSVTFTTVTGTAEIGFRLKNCTGNWACIDNFRLTYDGIVRDNINQELQKLITEAEGVVGDGVTGPQLQTAIDETKGHIANKVLMEDKDYAEIAQTKARALSRATLEYRISNATGTTPKVTTWDFVPTGVTIALGRMTVTGTSKERGFCWSTEPNPTVLDNRSTRYFSNNGNIYCIEHLQPATVYYVRPYAMTSSYQVGYGEVVKIATLPKGNVTTWYDNEGDEQTNFRIGSAVNEVQWLYDHLANIRGFNLSVHYVPGAGAGGGTADCSYGGWMRVSQNTPYQQTGTILHETNHGVGVGTTGEWYNNSNLRAETSRGLWLGPRANQVIKFLQNDKNATLTGDGTHMWPYGINGANEDQYNPENTLLYYANVLTTHALHQDGLVCSSSVGFATPAYVFQQDDETRYFIKSEDETNTGYLTMTSTGVLRTESFDAENADNFAWHITYDPKTSLYIFRNVGTGRYMSYSNNAIKGMNKTSLTSNEKFHLLPARNDVTMGSFTGTGYWITKGSGTALQAGTTNTTSPGLNFSNAATSQRWLFLTESEMDGYNQEAVKVVMAKLDALLACVEKVTETPHVCEAEDGDLEAVDQELASVVETLTAAKEGYTSPGEVTAAIDELETALVKFLAQVKVTDVTRPFDLTFLLVNPGLDKSSEGWSTTATNSYSCCEFFEKTFDFNQTTALKMPAGTYELRVQAYQRPGSASATYTDYNAGTDNVKAQIYLKTKSQKIKNIWEDAQKRALGGSTSNAGGKYVPNNMLAASKWFAAGWYDNSVMVKTTTSGTLKLGIRSTVTNEAYWTCFDNFRLLFYGDHAIDYITPVEAVEAEQEAQGQYYDLAGRRVGKPIRGLYIRNGKKILVK